MNVKIYVQIERMKIAKTPSVHVYMDENNNTKGDIEGTSSQQLDMLQAIVEAMSEHISVRKILAYITEGIEKSQTEKAKEPFGTRTMFSRIFGDKT